MKAKEYKNYMVIDTADGWMLANFDNLAEAVNFATNYNSRTPSFIEVQGTNEDTDTYLTAETLFSTKDAADYKHLKGLAERVFDLVDPWDRDDETVESTMENIKEYPLSIIEFLLDTIDALNA